MQNHRISEQEIRRMLDEILKRREFSSEPGNSKSFFKFISNIWEAIHEWMRDHLGYRQPDWKIRIDSELNNPVFQAAVKVLLILITSVLLFLLIKLVIKKVYLSGKMKQHVFSNVYEYLNRPQDAIDLYNKYMAAGEYSKALRFLFISLLLEFDRRKIIEIEKWKTNRMYFREIASKDETLAASMQEFINLFNECCYYNRNVDETSVRRWFEFYMTQKEKPYDSPA